MSIQHRFVSTHRSAQVHWTLPTKVGRLIGYTTLAMAIAILAMLTPIKSAVAQGTIVFTAPDLTVSMTDSAVTVPITFVTPADVTLSGFRVALTYDATKLAVVSCTLVNPGFCNTATAGELLFNGVNIRGIADGEIASIVFAIRSGATGTSALTMRLSQLLDTSLTDLTSRATPQGGSITIAAQPTDTPTAVPPTPIATATNTPVPPTEIPAETVTETNTPASPTATATATNTPVPPTAFANCGGYDVFETAPGVYAAPSFPGALLVGDNGDNWLQGTDGPDLILGLQGADDLWGRAGDDVICGGAGVDIIDGQQGNDTLYGDLHDDRLIGGPGNDTLYGGPGWDDLEGNQGDDTLYGGGDNDTLLGGNGNDVLRGAEGDDNLYGERGDDDLNGGPGNDLCQGGNGNDTIAACEGASAADTTADEALELDADAARRSNDGANGEHAIEQRIQQLFLPLVSNTD
ncbi:MAG: hypothetical protein R3E79_56265 [Caldilineaceae bacterium]